MPYDSVGNYTRVHNWEQDRINDISIDSSRMDEEFDDLANALSKVLLRAGNMAMENNLNMNGFKVQKIADGTAADDAVNKRQLDKVKSDLTISGAASSIQKQNLAANRALLSDGNGKVAASNISNTELGYLKGVTSSIQTQINNRTSLDATKCIWKDPKTGFMIMYVANYTPSNGVVTLPAPFSNNKYVVAPVSTRSGNNSTGWCQLEARTTTNFTVFGQNYENSHYGRDGAMPIAYIAVGK